MLLMGWLRWREVRNGVDRNIRNTDCGRGLDLLLVQIVIGFAAWIFFILLFSLMAAIHTYTQPKTIYVTEPLETVKKK